VSHEPHTTTTAITTTTTVIYYMTVVIVVIVVIVAVVPRSQLLLVAVLSMASLIMKYFIIGEVVGRTTTPSAPLPLQLQLLFCRRVN
jgi:hypothetical protein